MARPARSCCTAGSLPGGGVRRRWSWPCTSARRDGRLIGALPLFFRPRSAVAVASFLGGEHSALADLLLAADAAPAVAGLLAKRLVGSDAGYVDVHGLPGDSQLAQALGHSLEVRKRVESPVLDLTDGWEAVYSAKTSLEEAQSASPSAPAAR